MKRCSQIAYVRRTLNKSFSVLRQLTHSTLQGFTNGNTQVLQSECRLCWCIVFIGKNKIVLLKKSQIGLRVTRDAVIKSLV